MGQVSPVRSRAHGLPSQPTHPSSPHPPHPPTPHPTTTLPPLHPRRATPTGKGFNNLKEEYEPGTLGFDPLNLLPSDPQELKELQTKELNNGEGVGWHVWAWWRQAGLGMQAWAPASAQELIEEGRPAGAMCQAVHAVPGATHPNKLNSRLTEPCPGVPLRPRRRSQAGLTAQARPPVALLQVSLLPSPPPNSSALAGRLAMLAIAGFTLQELVPPHRESESVTRGPD